MVASHQLEPLQLDPERRLRRLQVLADVKAGRDRTDRGPGRSPEMRELIDTRRRTIGWSLGGPVTPR